MNTGGEPNLLELDQDSKPPGCRELETTARTRATTTTTTTKTERSSEKTDTTEIAKAEDITGSECVELVEEEGDLKPDAVDTLNELLGY